MITTFSNMPPQDQNLLVASETAHSLDIAAANLGLASADALAQIVLDAFLDLLDTTPTITLPLQLALVLNPDSRATP